jgi:hypothetical protein
MLLIFMHEYYTWAGRQGPWCLDYAVTCLFPEVAFINVSAKKRYIFLVDSKSPSFLRAQLGCLRNFVSSKFRIFQMVFFISYTIRKWQQFRENNRNWRLILGPCRLILEPCMLTLKSLHAQPGFMEAHPRPVEVCLGAMEPHSGALEA